MFKLIKRIIPWNKLEDWVVEIIKAEVVSALEKEDLTIKELKRKTRRMMEIYISDVKDMFNIPKDQYKLLMTQGLTETLNILFNNIDQTFFSVERDVVPYHKKPWVLVAPLELLENALPYYFSDYIWSSPRFKKYDFTSRLFFSRRFVWLHLFGLIEDLIEKGVKFKLNYEAPSPFGGPITGRFVALIPKDYYLYQNDDIPIAITTFVLSNKNANWWKIGVETNFNFREGDYRFTTEIIDKWESLINRNLNSNLVSSSEEEEQ